MATRLTTTARLNDAVVYVATNDGYLHAIDVDSGDELWSFIPQELLGDLINVYNRRRRRQPSTTRWMAISAYSSMTLTMMVLWTRQAARMTAYSCISVRVVVVTTTTHWMSPTKTNRNSCGPGSVIWVVWCSSPGPPLPGSSQGRRRHAESTETGADLWWRL